jgi:uncharacterized coiled-coil protein SlyX
LRERIEELEFVKDFQQELIADFELVTGQELSKKYLPEQLSAEIQKTCAERSRSKKQKILRQSTSIKCSG